MVFLNENDCIKAALAYLRFNPMNSIHVSCFIFSMQRISLVFSCTRWLAKLHDLEISGLLIESASLV